MRNQLVYEAAILQGRDACAAFYDAWGDYADRLVKDGALSYPEHPYADERGSDREEGYNYGWNSCYPERWCEQDARAARL